MVVDTDVEGVVVSIVDEEDVVVADVDVEGVLGQHVDVQDVDVDDAEVEVAGNVEEEDVVDGIQMPKGWMSQ